VLGANPEGIVVQWFVQGAQAPQVHVTRDGSFRFAPARDRPGTLYAFDPHAGSCALLEGLRPTDGPFEVRCVAGHRIAGRILAYTDRTPRPRLLCVRGPVKIAVRVQPDGSFEVPTAPSGTWRLVWALGSRLEDAIEVEAGTQDVMLSPPDAPGEER